MKQQIKKTIFALGMFPLSVFAQQNPANDLTKTPTKVHYGKATIHHEHIFINGKPGSSQMKTTDGYLLVDGLVYRDSEEYKPKKDGSTDYLWTAVAKKVEISSLSSQVILRGDVLSYDNGTKKGVLKGHVTAIENNNRKKIGKKVEIDFSGSEYRIVSTI